MFWGSRRRNKMPEKNHFTTSTPFDPFSFASTSVLCPIFFINLYIYLLILIECQPPHLARKHNRKSGTFRDSQHLAPVVHILSLLSWSRSSPRGDMTGHTLYDSPIHQNLDLDTETQQIDAATSPPPSTKISTQLFTITTTVGRELCTIQVIGLDNILQHKSPQGIHRPEQLPKSFLSPNFALPHSTTFQPPAREIIFTPSPTTYTKVLPPLIVIRSRFEVHQSTIQRVKAQFS